MSSKTLLIAASLGIACSAASLADSPDRRVLMREPPAFAEVDADGDRMVTETEFLAFIESRSGGPVAVEDPERWRSAAFDEADADGDGHLSREEFDSMPRRMVRKMRLRDPEALFAQGDTDRDGVLNEQEFESLMSAMPRVRRHPGEHDEQQNP